MPLCYYNLLSRTGPVWVDSAGDSDIAIVEKTMCIHAPKNGMWIDGEVLAGPFETLEAAKAAYIVITA